MIESHFIRSLAGYFGMPLLMFVSFALLLFWLCKIFRNTVVTDVPNNHPEGNIVNRPAVPPRPNNMRTLTTVALLFVLCQLSFETLHNKTVGAEENPVCEQNPRKAFKKVMSYIEDCSSDEIHMVLEKFGTSESVLCMKYCANNLSSINAYIILGMGACNVLTLLVVVFIWLRKPRNTNDRRQPS